jgi:catechol 2,3-dioxygenase-like lactoylglutathione lyase family enzyme
VLRISTVNLWVHDQEAALEFWTDKVGFELRADATFPELGGFRWLTVGPRDEDQVELVLQAVPQPPVLTEGQSELVRAARLRAALGARRGVHRAA